MPASKDDWIVSSADDSSSFQMRLEACTREHAESALSVLLPSLIQFPFGLSLARLDADGEPGRPSLYRFARRHNR